MIAQIAATIAACGATAYAAAYLGDTVDPYARWTAPVGVYGLGTAIIGAFGLALAAIWS